LIVADANLNELGRVVGSRSGRRWRSSSTREGLQGQPVEAAARWSPRAGEATELRRLRVALWHVERGEFDQVRNAVQGHLRSLARRELLLARRERRPAAGRRAAHLTATKALIADFFRRPGLRVLVAGLAETEPRPRRSCATPSKSVERWSSNRRRRSDFARETCCNEQGDIALAVGSTDDAKGFYSRAAEPTALTSVAPSPSPPRTWAAATRC